MAPSREANLVWAPDLVRRVRRRRENLPRRIPWRDGSPAGQAANDRRAGAERGSSERESREQRQAEGEQRASNDESRCGDDDGGCRVADGDLIETHFYAFE